MDNRKLGSLNDESLFQLMQDKGAKKAIMLFAPKFISAS